MKDRADNHLTYRDAGVDIARGNRVVDDIKALAKGTAQAGVLAGVGGFGAMFELPVEEFARPVLVSGADGVGTKLRLAIDCGRHTTVGIDLVAMCANDVLVQGARPLFFLDYFAAGVLDEAVVRAVVSGIARGCELAGAALIGGETAEMPGMYPDGDYDLAGFCVGIVEKSRIIDGTRIRPGDRVVGLASSGPHSNGYSLIRRVLEMSGQGPDSGFEDATLGDVLLEPTRIYAGSVRALTDAVEVRGLAHVTGGGITGNLPRILPAGLRARLDESSWGRPAIFGWLQRIGGIASSEMYSTFNCGLGMVAIVPAEQTAEALDILAGCDEHAWEIGVVEESTRGAPEVVFD